MTPSARPAKSFKFGGLKFVTGLLLVADCWMILYLFFFFRYGVANGAEGPLPFFPVNDYWMDFFNPIDYVWNLDPYSAQWGNSPPFMMFVGYLLSLPMRIGISENLVYLGYCLVVMGILWVLIFKMARGYGMSILESLTLSLAACGSFPFVYCFDRGNFVLLAALTMALSIVAYHHEKYFLAAFFVGIAAALKLYPALLGISFLADRKFRQAVFCAFTGIVVSVFPLFLYQGGVVRNLFVFLEKSGSYSKIGNGILGWLVDDKNSFYQLLLIPKMLSKSPLESIEQVPSFVGAWKIFLTLLLLACAVICLFLKRNHDRVLVMTMLMLGYPIESGVYNLVIAVFPILYWCSQEHRNSVLPWLGCGLITMKSVFVLQSEPVLITWQAVLNPILELAIIGYVVFLRRKELTNLILQSLPIKAKGKVVE